MRRLLPLLVCLGLIAMVAVALAQVGGPPRARAAAVATSGAFGIEDGREGKPIFAAAGIAPGDSASGTVAIRDTGSVPVALTLRRGELVDSPGLGGALLSGRLDLTVVDVTEAAHPRTIYSGPLDSMPDQAAGELAPGATRTYEFTATLPDSGAPSFQNAVQAASTRVAYTWIATEASTGGSGTGGGNANPGVTEPGVGVSSASSALELTVKKIQPRVQGGRIVARARCNQSCRVLVRGRIHANAGRRRRAANVHFNEKRLSAPHSRLVRVPLPRGLRRWLRATPGRKRLRANLRFIAVDSGGRRDIVRRKVALRPG